MTWTRLSDNFTDRPEMLRISRSARLLHVEAMVWCNKHTTDGVIPASALSRISDGDIHEDLEQLLAVELWWPATAEYETVNGQPDAWQLDWSDQEPAANVKARKDYRAGVQKKYRDRKDRHGRGDHSACDPRFCKAGVTGNATGNNTAHETPSRPVTVPPRRGRDGDQGEPAALADGAGAPPLGDDRWKRVDDWGGATALAHPHTSSDDGFCTFVSSEPGSFGVVCGGAASNARHHHQSDPLLGFDIPDDLPRTWVRPGDTSIPGGTPLSHRPCVICGHPRPHPVHTDRNKSETQ